MKIATSSSTGPDTSEAISTAFSKLSEKLGTVPDLIFFQGSITYGVEEVHQELGKLVPAVHLHGGTSCLGGMTEDGFISDNGRGLTMLGISDPDGGYGVGAASMDENPRAAAAVAITAALDDAGRPGEMPELVRLTAAPGAEEQVLLGIEDVLGPDVPVIGGSAADNTVEGNWRQFTHTGVYTNAVVVTAMFPSVKTAFAFHSGYSPTEVSGVATRADGRTLYEIDGRPAAEVYNEWTAGAIADVLPGGGNVLGLTTLNPLGRVVGDVGGIAYYRLSHPDGVTEDLALTLFSDIQEGDRLILMSGSRDSLISRAGRVAESALDAGALTAEEISGALVVYCAGCMLTIQSDMEQVVGSINRELKGAPFQGAFTFGEQGCFVGGENRHGNLMISVVVFGR